MVYEFHFLKGIHVGGCSQFLACVQHTGIGTLDHRIYDVIFGGKIVINTSLSNPCFLGNIAYGNGLGIGGTHKFLHGIQNLFPFIMVLHKKSSVFSLEYFPV